MGTVIDCSLAIAGTMTASVDIMNIATSRVAVVLSFNFILFSPLVARFRLSACHGSKHRTPEKAYFG